jgi:hypothetical protein
VLSFAVIGVDQIQLQAQYILNFSRHIWPQIIYGHLFCRCCGSEDSFYPLGMEVVHDRDGWCSVNKKVRGYDAPNKIPAAGAQG